MSIVLSWETPADLYASDRMAFRVEIVRVFAFALGYPQQIYIPGDAGGGYSSVPPFKVPDPMGFEVGTLGLQTTNNPPAVPGVILTKSAPIGMYEDTENNDISANYNIVYYNLDGVPIAQLHDQDIRRWARPTNSCKLEFCSTRPDSSPWRLRHFKLTEVPQESFVRDFYANVDGKAMAILSWDWRMRLVAEAWDKAFEFVVPRLQEINIPDLMNYGSWVELDGRGLPK